MRPLAAVGCTNTAPPRPTHDRKLDSCPNAASTHVLNPAEGTTDFAPFAALGDVSIFDVNQGTVTKVGNKDAAWDVLENNTHPALGIRTVSSNCTKIVFDPAAFMNNEHIIMTVDHTAAADHGKAGGDTYNTCSTALRCTRKTQWGSRRKTRMDMNNVSELPKLGLGSKKDMNNVSELPPVRSRCALR